MAKLLESQIEGSVVAYAERNGWLVRKMTYPGRRGCPDRWFFHAKRAGVPLIIEFKRPGGALRPDQTHEIARLGTAGMEVHVVNTIEAGKALLDA